MGEAAKILLWDSLKIDDTYEPGDVPPQNDPDSQEFLWDELLEQAREDGTVLSFFIVNETVNRRSESLFVSPDWPSAEAFAKSRLTAVQ